MTIGERIRQRREELGISQTALADAVNSTKQNIYKYETGAITNIPSDKIEQIAAVLHVTPSYLMGWEESRTEINERIKQRRKELGLSAEQVADMIGVSPATVYRYESSDIKNMPAERLKPIADALHTTPEWLMGWSASPQKAETAAPESDGSLESDEFLKTYARLSPAKQSLVQSLVRELSSAEEQADDSQD